MPLRQRLEVYFAFKGLGTNWRIEILAGFTTFMTMAYIVFVNPAILHEAGLPLAAATAATCISAAVGSLLMGAFARYPIALAPGMGLNAYFTYVVVKGLGVPWQAALGAVFVSGVVFLLLTLIGARQLIVAAIPGELYGAVAAGVGLFIALIGFRNSGIVVASSSTLVALGNLREPGTALALFGLALMAALLAWRVRAAILIGIVATTVLGLITGVAKWTPQAYRWSDLYGWDLRRSSLCSCSSICSTTSARWLRWASGRGYSTRRTGFQGSTGFFWPMPQPASWVRSPALPRW
jgi:adenine/guanine/hypoxanthine permease